MKIIHFFEITFIIFGICGYWFTEGIISLVFCLLGMLGVLMVLNIPSVWIEDGFATISQRLKISALLAGGLFLAIASSSAEFFTSMSGVVWYKIFSIGFDTLIWSSLFNLCIILGVCTYYKRNLSVDKYILKRDMPFYGVTIILLLLLAADGIYSSLDFLLLILFYLVYILFLYFDKAEPYQETTSDSWKTVGFKLIFGLLAIAFLAHSLVSLGQRSVEVAFDTYQYVLPVGILACTLYGPGTSVADMFMSIAATKKGEDSAAVINSISSNTFDLTICIGVPGLIYTIMTGKPIVIDLSTSFLLISMLLISYIIVWFFLRDKVIRRKEGNVLIIYYAICTVIYLINVI